MIQENYDYLKNQVKYTGFGETLQYQLKEHMEKDEPTFQLKYKPEFGKDQAEATLNFRRADDGKYFFNTYDLEVKKENTEPLKQTFYLERPKSIEMDSGNGTKNKEWVNSTITLKEAFNMMDLDKDGQGRSVYKEFVNKDNQKYSAYVKLDFKDTDKDGNFLIKKMPDFDLEAKLAAYPIKELANEKSRGELLESLKKGNEQMVTMQYNDKEEKQYIRTNPQFKTITVFDENSQRVRQGQREGETNGQQRAEKTNQKQSEEGSEEPAKSNRRRQGRSVSH